jgi:hypothetical protein
VGVNTYGRTSFTSGTSVSRYFVVPYLIQVKDRRKEAGAIRPIDNVNGAGLSLREAVERVVVAMLQRSEGYNSLSDPDTKFTVTEAFSSDNHEALMVTIEPGKRGHRSRLAKADGTTVDRHTGDTEHIPLRALMYFPRDSYAAFLFIERLGRMGTVTFMRNALIPTLTWGLRYVTVKIPPITTLQALQAASIRNVVFRAPRRRDRSGKLIEYGPSVELRTSYRGGRRVKGLLTEDGRKIDRSKVFGLLQEGTEEAGVSSPLDTSDWEASLNVELPSGRPATFDMNSDGPGLVYPLLTEVDTTVGGSRYPEPEDFLSVCQTILDDIRGQLGVGDDHNLPTASSFNHWDGTGVEPWKVTYYDDPEPD